MPLPLADLRIIDLTQAIFGAGATQLLADLGADVIKIEPPWGEMMRRPRDRYRTRNGEDFDESEPDLPPWLAMNRNKRSVALNLKSPAALDVCRDLIRTADVVIHNFRIGRMEELQLDFESVRAISPAIIYVELTAFGPSGPMRRWAGGDMWAQALGGAVSVNGTPTSGPSLVPVPAADQSGAVIAAFAILAALRARRRTGEAQLIQTSLLDSILNVQSGQLADFLIDGINLGRSGRGWRGAFPFGAYTASDGDVVIIHGEDPDDWRTVCELLGLEHLLADESLATAEQRRGQRWSLYPILDKAFSRKTRAEWQQAFHARKLRCDPCLSYEEIPDHPQIRANEHFTTVMHHQRGDITLVGPPFKLNGERLGGTGAQAPPRIGAHTVEVLVELGYDEQRIRGLHDSGDAISPPSGSQSEPGT